MMISLLSLAMMAQSEATDLTAPPISIRKEQTCVCSEDLEGEFIVMEGLVVDAEVTLAPDRLSVNDRQTTIFNVENSQEKDFKGRVRVWHSSNKKQCGLTFDYGLKYKIVLRKLENGALETDQCLMKTLDDKE